MEFKAKLLFARSMQAMFDLSLLRDAFFISTSENGTVRSRRISSKLSTRRTSMCVCMAQFAWIVCMCVPGGALSHNRGPQHQHCKFSIGIKLSISASCIRSSVQDWISHRKRLECAPPYVPTFGKCIKWRRRTMEWETERTKEEMPIAMVSVLSVHFLSHTADWFYAKIYNFEHQNRFSSISEQRIRDYIPRQWSDTQVHRCDAFASVSNKSNHLSVLHI